MDPRRGPGRAPPGTRRWSPGRSPGPQGELHRLAQAAHRWSPRRWSPRRAQGELHRLAHAAHQLSPRQWLHEEAPGRAPPDRTCGASVDCMTMAIGLQKKRSPRRAPQARAGSASVGTTMIAFTKRPRASSSGSHRQRNGGLHEDGPRRWTQRRGSPGRGSERAPWDRLGSASVDFTTMVSRKEPEASSTGSHRPRIGALHDDGLYEEAQGGLHRLVEASTRRPRASCSGSHRQRMGGLHGDGLRGEARAAELAQASHR